MRYYSARAAGVTGPGVGSDMSAPTTTSAASSYPAHDSGPSLQTNVTLTFTPSTLRSMEDALMDGTHLARPPVSHQHQAGFVTPHVAGVFSPLTQHRWQGGVTTVNSADTFLSPVHEQPRLVPQTGHTRGGRRPKDDYVSPEEELRRRQRRERNKQAAARCRRRRLDLINTLQGETEDLERRRRGLEREIQHLQAEKEELAYLMAAHRGTCNVPAESHQHFQQENPPQTEDIKATVKPEPVEEDERSGALSSHQSLTTPPLPAQQPRQRPNSLPVASFASSRPSNVNVAVPISTPSHGLALNFDSMMEGGTGLTPVATSNMLPMLPVYPSSLATPVVTSEGEHRREDMLSPDSANIRLVSL